MEEDFSTIVNYLWTETMKKLSSVLTEQEVNKFCSNDYFYLCTIHSLGKPNFTAIAEALQVSKPAVSVMIRKLLSMELVVKEKSSEDKRVTYVKLTEKGLKVIKGDHNLYLDLSEQIRSIVNSEMELQVIERTMAKLASNIASRLD